jgi:ribonuclease HI
MKPEEREKILATLKKNIDLFAWHPSDMPGIDETIITHKLSISPETKPVSQRKRKVGEERREAINEEVTKLKEAGFIEEIKYPSWLANVVMVKKANGKWRMCVDFTDLNKACPKDPYPLPNIDRLIDGASGYKMLSFMDAYSGYNQIKMNPSDAPHTAFMTNTCNYFYNVMPFGLKNAGATYQRLMDRVFSEQIGKNLEVYIDDMVVKTAEEGEHDQDLGDILASVRKYNMRLNPAKCSFGVQSGKFLGFMLTNRGIEANPDKCQAIIDMRSPTSVKEVQQLTGRIAALSRFLSCAGEKAFHFFSTLRKSERFVWSTQCEEAFQKLKTFLASPPILTRPEKGNTLYLYLAVSDKALSSALVQEIKGEEKPIYFVSRTFKGAEAKYQKIEKLSLAVIVTARKLRQYFQSHKIVVKTDYPIKNVLRKPDLAGRMVAWSVELSEFDVTFSPRGAIKSQILADFLLELTTPAEENSEQPWTLSVDGASNIKGSGAGVVLEGPDGVLIEQSLRFAFKASNNQAEYEALIAGMKLAREMDITDLKAKSDSQLVTNQVSGEFQAKDPQLIKYLEKVRSLASLFRSFELIYVPREQNARADLLSKLASTKKPGSNRTFIQETIANPSITTEEVMMIIEAEDWRAPIIRYLQEDVLPAAKEEAYKLKRAAAWYSMLGDKLYKRGFSGPIMLCVSQEEAKGILEEIHEGSCGSHIGARALAGKILRAGFYWPEVHSDAARYVKTCDKCQRFANLHYAPGEPLKSVLSPWPFFMWGTDILGPFPASTGQVKWIIVAIDYFTKWIEAEALSNISADQVKKFYWRKIICRFGLPKYIVSDNGTQFASEKVVEFCKGKGIQNTFISVEHPQANGQAESANKVILKAIKRRITSKGEGWVAHLLPILWSYHTTPQSSTGEAPFTMVYGTDAMIPAEINPPSWRRDTLTLEENSEALEENLDLIQELRDKAHFREFVSKQRAARRYNTRVIPRRFREGDLVLKRPMGKDKGGKLAANWEGPFRVNEVFEGGAYRLETMEGEILHRTWNVANLRFYYS